MSDVIETSRWKQVATALLLGFISIVFALEFGAQSRGCDAQSAGSSVAATVYGETITSGDFRAAFVLSGADRYPADLARQNNLREKVLNALVERELLAHEAERLGFEVEPREVMRKLSGDGVIYTPANSEAADLLAGGPRPVDFKDEAGNFDVEGAKRFIRNYLRRSVEEFTAEQAHEMLAERVRDTVRASVTVSPTEVWDAYVREHENATIDYIRFSPSFYRDALTYTPDELNAWMTAHQTEINAELERTRHRYTNLEKQVRARHILIKVESDATPEVKGAARAKIEALLARARAGEDFAALARDNSEDTGSARKGGDLGFNPRGRMVAPFDEAQFNLGVGQISDIVESNYGFHVIKVEAIREGNVPEDEAKREIAERLYREERAKALARAEADRALGELRGGATMEAVETRLRGGATTELQDPYTPHVQTSRPFGRGGQPITGAADSGAIARAAYALTMEAPLATEVASLGDDFVVYRLKERNVADRATFGAEDRARITQGLLVEKQQEALIAYVRSLREAARTAGELRVNESVVAEQTAPQEGEEPAQPAEGN